MLECHRALLWIETGGDGVEQRLVHGRVYAQRHARLHCRADQGRRPALRRRAEVVGRFASVAVEVLVEYELAMARDQQAVDLQRVEGIHRHVKELLYQPLDRVARDSDVWRGGDGPAVVELERRRVVVAWRREAAGIERAARAVGNASEIVGAAAQRQGDHAVFVMALNGIPGSNQSYVLSVQFDA